LDGLRLRFGLSKRQTITIQILDHHLADAMWSHARSLKDHGPALLKVGIQAVEILHVEIDISLESLACTLRQVSSTNLEVNPNVRTLDDGVHPAGLVSRGLEHAVHGIEAEPEDVDVRQYHERLLLPERPFVSNRDIQLVILFATKYNHIRRFGENKLGCVACLPHAHIHAVGAAWATGVETCSHARELRGDDA
jgi:hypothetical protein